MTQVNIPDGYRLFFKDGSFNDAIAPVFYKFGENGPEFCIRVEKHHCNPMGICHGAVYMALMDIALGSTLCHKMGKYTGTPTINISLDYLASSTVGELLFVEAEPLRLTRTLGFAQGFIKGAQGEHKVRANGTFKLPHDIEAAAGISVADFQALLEAGVDVNKINIDFSL